MAVTAVIGSQWGDEGKGKIVDLLAQKADMVIRFNGGNNAGHTIINEHGESKLHIVPAGIFNPNTRCIIGSGTFVHMPTLLEELDDLRSRGVRFNNLYISKKAHLVMPWHVITDGAQEQKRSKADKIGTTKRGIGPAAASKYGRHNLRVGDLLDPNAFADKFVDEFYRADAILKKLYNHRGLDYPPEIMLRDFLAKAGEVLSYAAVANTEKMAWEALDNDDNVLLEGAQAVLLGINHGTYPYCTSSDCGYASASEGSGIPANKITERIAVVKAYSTRIGPGAFPTYTEGSAIDEELRCIGNEYGATTGRPRMCGWIDLPLLRYADRLNDFTAIAITKLDVLSGIRPIQAGIGYKKCQDHNKQVCLDAECGFNGAKAYYESISGWDEDITSVRNRSELPDGADVYVRLIEDAFNGAKARFISVGPERSQTIVEEA